MPRSKVWSNLIAEIKKYYFVESSKSEVKPAVEAKSEDHFLAPTTPPIRRASHINKSFSRPSWWKMIGMRYRQYAIKKVYDTEQTLTLKQECQINAWKIEGSKAWQQAKTVFDGIDHADDEYMAYYRHSTFDNFHVFCQTVLKYCVFQDVFAKANKLHAPLDLDPITKKNIYRYLTEYVLSNWIEDQAVEEYFAAKENTMEVDALTAQLARHALQVNPVYVPDEEAGVLALSYAQAEELLRDYLRHRMEWEYLHPNKNYTKGYLDQYTSFSNYLHHPNVVHHHHTRSRQHSRRSSRDGIPVSPRRSSNETKDSTDETLNTSRHASVIDGIFLVRTLVWDDFPTFANVIGWGILFRRPLLFLDMLLGDPANFLASKICQFNSMLFPERMTLFTNGLFGGLFILLKLLTLSLDTVFNWENIHFLGEKFMNRFAHHDVSEVPVLELRKTIERQFRARDHQDSDRSTNSHIIQKIASRQSGSPSLSPRGAPITVGTDSPGLNGLPLTSPSRSPNHKRHPNDAAAVTLLPGHISAKSWVNHGDFDLKVLINADSQEDVAVAASAESLPALNL